MVDSLARATAGLIRDWAIPLGIVLGLLAVWELTVRLAHVPSWLLPRPSAIAVELEQSRALLLEHTWVTFQEVLVGFTLALAIGLALAALIAYFRALERSLYPFVIASQTVPYIAIAPLLLIWVGYGLASKVIMVALISFFSIVVNTVDGLKAVDADLVNLMRSLGASRWQVFTKVRVPTSLPFVFSGIRIAIAVSVIGAVVGEWVGASGGLGYLMRLSVPQFQTARVFAAIVILSVMGVALFALAALLERVALPWQRSEKKQRLLHASR